MKFVSASFLRGKSMAKYVMRLHKEPFELIQNGQKSIELRLNDEKRQQIQVGDEIEFRLSTEETKRLFCEVITLHHFPSFEALYAYLPLSKCGYTDENIQTASPLDMEKYYAKEEQEKYGVLGIEIRKK